LAVFSSFIDALVFFTSGKMNISGCHGFKQGASDCIHGKKNDGITFLLLLHFGLKNSQVL